MRRLYDDGVRIAYYVSGHGFGHATRSCVVLAALAEEHDVWMVTPVSEAFLRQNTSSSFRYRHARLDVGVAQENGLAIDFASTLRAVRELESRTRALAEEETDWLRSQMIDGVLVDIPPVACAAANRAGLPCAVISNFTWDDIYRPYESSLPGFAEIADALAARYAQASALLELPFSTEMPAIPRRVAMGLVARTRRLDGAEVRSKLGLDGRRVGLLSYGGLGLGGYAPARWLVPGEWSLITVGGVRGDWKICAGVANLEPDALERLGIRYPDLVGSADAVLTKPGYGIVSDCIANRTPIIYSDRGPFAEYPRLVDGIRRYLPSVFVPQEELREGDMRGPLEAIDSRGWPEDSLPAASPEEIGMQINAVLFEQRVR